MIENNDKYARVNPLPVPTWNHLGVNWTEADLSCPEGKKDIGLSVESLPPGIEALSSFPDLAEPVDSGVGNAYDSHVIKHANVSCFLAVKDKVEQLVPLTVSLTDGIPSVIGDYGIYAEEGAAVTVMHHSCSVESVQGCDMGLTRIYAGKDSHIRLIQVQNLGRKCRSFSAVSVYAESGARVEVIRAVLGGESVVCGSKALLAGRESSFLLNTVYFGDGVQRFDFNDIADHRGRCTESTMETAGVLAGESSKILRGTIDFKRGAVCGVGYEMENVLMMGPKVKNRTVPLILCGEEQVEGHHAATVGRLDEDQLYYLCSRGLTETQARKLLVEGRFRPVLDQIPVDMVRETLTAQIERRLEQNEKCES